MYYAKRGYRKCLIDLMTVYAQWRRRQGGKTIVTNDKGNARIDDPPPGKYYSC